MAGFLFYPAQRLLPFIALLFGPPLLALGADRAEPQTRIAAAHAPKQPRSGETVVVSLKVPGSVKAGDLALQYQVIEPGKYIDLNDPAYVESWTKVPLSERKRAESDVTSTVFTADLPGELQTHRRLIRYRIYSLKTEAVVAPAEDDPQRNYAYFVYDGIPEWRGAINPKGSGQQREIVRFGTNVMRSVQAYHLISKQASIENVTWHEPKHYMHPSASEYKYTGTLIANGKAHDHVRFRARGGTWRHAMGKNMWKIDFNKGHNLEARDNWDRKYETKWGKLNLGACIQQGDYGMRGEQGMFEALAFRLFNLAGVEAPHTHWVQLRIIDEPEESPADQYRGDFWGLYLAVENVDDDFLKEHGFPDGNLYKMDIRGPETEHLAEGAPADRADVLQFMNDLRRNPDEKWWRSNVDLPGYYSYRSILECIHHYDIGMGKNYFYFRNPEAKRWQVVPWDVDLTWADHMFGNGAEPFHRAGLLRSAPCKAEYEARLIEIRDLLFNPEQTGALIDEYAAIISDPNGGPSMVDADRAKWDYHPIMSSQLVVRGKSEPGLFYRGSPTGDFRGMVQLMKGYIEQRGQWVDRTLLAAASLPATPKIAPVEKFDFSAPQLKMRLTAGGSAPKVKWRLAEITDAKDRAPNGRQPRKYEIETLWEKEGGASAEIPTKGLEKGHTYRIRARVQDKSGRWSHWSAPVQFAVPQAR